MNFGLTKGIKSIVDEYIVKTAITDVYPNYLSEKTDVCMNNFRFKLGKRVHEWYEYPSFLRREFVRRNLYLNSRNPESDEHFINDREITMTVPLFWRNSLDYTKKTSSAVAKSLISPLKTSTRRDFMSFKTKEGDIYHSNGHLIMDNNKDILFMITIKYCHDEYTEGRTFNEHKVIYINNKVFTLNEPGLLYIVERVIPYIKHIGTDGYYHGSYKLMAPEVKIVNTMPLYYKINKQVLYKNMMNNENKVNMLTHNQYIKSPV